MTNKQKREKYLEAGYDDFCEAHQIPYNDECPDCSDIEQRQLASDAGMSQADFDRQRQPKSERGKILRWVKAAQDRITYLVEQEKQALIDIDALPVGSHIRAAHWNFIKELGCRKNELQDLVKKMEASAASPVNPSMNDEHWKEFTEHLAYYYEIVGGEKGHDLIWQHVDGGIKYTTAQLLEIFKDQSSKINISSIEPGEQKTRTNLAQRNSRDFFLKVSVSSDLLPENEGTIRAQISEGLIASVYQVVGRLRNTGVVVEEFNPEIK